MNEIKEYLERRIKELYEADSEFCQKRWDMDRPEFERKLYREQSNQVTFARQELQQVLKRIPATPDAKDMPCDHNFTGRYNVYCGKCGKHSQLT